MTAQTSNVWSTRAAFARATMDTSIKAVQVLGYASPADGGAASYARLSAAPNPVLAGHLQTADGAWWALDSTGPVRVECFGVSKGASDNTAALQAIDAWCAHIGGLVANFAPHTYNFAGTVTFASQHLRLSGAGSSGTILNFTGAGTGDCLVFQGTPGASVCGIEVRSLRVQASARTGGAALRFLYCNNSLADDVRLDTVWNGVEAYITNDIRLADIVIICQGAWGVYWHADAIGGSNRCDSLTLDYVYINGTWTADGLWWDGNAETLNAQSLQAINCRIGCWIKNSAESAAYVPQCGNFWNAQFDGMTLRAMQIDGGGYFRFTDCLIENTSTPGAPAAPAGQGFGDYEAILINADCGTGESFTHDLWFENCLIGNSRYAAVTCYANCVNFRGCCFVPGGKAGVNMYDAVTLAAGAADVSLTGCCFHYFGSPNNFRYCVNVAAGTSRILLGQNNYYGAQTGPVYWANTDPASSHLASNVVSTNGLPQTTEMSGAVIPGKATGTTTLTAQQVLGGVFQSVGAPGADFTQTTPTAAQLVAALNNPAYEQGVLWLFVNSTAYKCTLAGGTGVTFSGNLAGDSSHVAISSLTQRSFMIVFNNTAAGSEAVTIYG